MEVDITLKSGGTEYMWKYDEHLSNQILTSVPSKRGKTILAS
jgi:hypothetical protein